MKLKITLFMTLVFLFSCLLALNAAEDNNKKILILHSYHKADWTDNIMSGIESVFSEQKNFKLYVEYMDTKEFNSPKYLKMYHDALRVKYMGLKFDLILTSDDFALLFAIEHNQDLFDNAPIAFCGVNRFTPESIKDKKVTGVIEKGDFKPTLDFIDQAIPGWKKLYVLYDNTKTGKINMENLTEVMKNNFPKINIIHLNDKTLEEVDNSLKQGNSRDAAAFFIAFWKDKNGKAVSIPDLEKVFRNSNIPVFGRSEWMIGHGMTGGKCVSGFNQGKTAAKLALQILNSEDRNIPNVIMDSPNQFMFDYKELKKHHLQNTNLPNNSLVINRPITLRQIYLKNKDFFWIVTSLFGLLIITVCILFFDKIKRSRAEKALLESENHLNITLESIGDAVIATDANGIIVRINKAAVSFTGWSPDEAIGKKLQDVFRIYNSETEESLERPLHKVLKEGKVVDFTQNTILKKKDNSTRKIADSLAPIMNEMGEIVGMVIVFRDITDENKLQEQLHQSQKMKAIGQLASGIAHDFNNLLAGIMGNADLLKMENKLESEELSMIDDIIKASKRASELTRQLLTFTRKTPIQNVNISVHEILNDTIDILLHTIDPGITIKKQFNADSDIILGDYSQIQNALLNLGVNARDAMPDGGEMTFMTEKINISVDDELVVAGNLVPSEYIEIKVKDTGYGIDKKNISQIFDPFFSTKPPESGTGLGLASVYGCITNHNGHISVKSKIGNGTTFRILLHCVKSGQKTINKDKRKIIKGKGSIIVVEDEDFIRELCTRCLGKLGYSVKAFSNGLKAAEHYKKNTKKTDLVILDMMMPVISGEKTFKLLQEINPDVKVLILSGYTKKETLDNMLNNGAIAFLPKPFNIYSLSKEVSKCLYL